MRLAVNELLFAFSQALDCVEQDLLGVTTNHSKRVALMGMRVCESLGMDDIHVFDMASCCILHDNALTSYLLLAGSAQTRAKLENISFHCVAGEENARHFPFMGDVKGIILNHHENWDGTGFFGRKGKEVNLRSAILHLADALDLRFHLGKPVPGREEEIVEYVLQKRGLLFAPEAVDAFVAVCTPGLLEQALDENIDQALEHVTPPISREIPSTGLLNACEIFAGIIDAKSRFTCNHSRGIAQKAGQVARAMGYTPSHRDRLVMAALLHDLGKLAIPNNLLEKPGPLLPEEYGVMKTHVRITWDILSKVEGMTDIAYWGAAHHEKLDGSGYPFGYTAEKLSEECRLLACIDIYQAVTEDRPYRAGMSHERAMSILQTMAGEGKLDADLVDKLEEALAG